MASAMATCTKCAEPFTADNSLRRECCESGVLHLLCIESEDLERCYACQKDPMVGWVEMKQFRLRPLDPANPPSGPPRLAFLSCSYGQIESNGELLTVERNVACANGSLEACKGMVDSIVDEMTCDWSGKIEVTCLDVCATLLDGVVLVEKKSFPEHSKRSRRAIKEMVTSLIRESVIRFAGAKADKFSKEDIDCYRLDQIVELTIQFICTQWTYHTRATHDNLRPYETVSSREVLGVWRCFACLSGLARPFVSTVPPAKRLIVEDIS